MARLRATEPHPNQLPLMVAEVDTAMSLPGLRDPGITRPVGPIRIERFILHELDNQTPAPKLVDEIPTLSNDIERYFAAHITTAISRADWRAQFKSRDDGVASLCTSLLGSPEDFVQASQAMAQRLFAQMRPRTISAGDFVVIVYRVGDEDLRYIALLKLDPDQRLTRKIVPTGTKMRLSISVEKNILPDSAKLQKCALVSPETDFQITLLDTQAGPRADGIAAFFYSGFLAAELLPSPRRRTRDFIRRTDMWLASTEGSLSPEEIAAFYSSRRKALTADVLDIPTFIEEASQHHQHIADELTTMLDGIGEASSIPETVGMRSFVVDRSFARSIVERIVIELDGGARLIVPAERFSALVKIAPFRTAENKYRIIIESQTLREVSEK